MAETPQKDYRCSIRTKSPLSFPGLEQAGIADSISHILGPLFLTGQQGSICKLVFPYTPSVTYGAIADYQTYDFEHAIYKYNAWTRSSINEISIDAMFTAQTQEEARYMLAAIHFFRIASKGIWGRKNTQEAAKNYLGSPPPILLFNYLGEQMFNDVPVIVKSFNMTLDQNVDYINVFIDKKGNLLEPDSPNNKVPTKLSMNIILDTQYSPADLEKNFSMQDFISGKGLKGGYL